MRGHVPAWRLSPSEEKKIRDSKSKYLNDISTCCTEDVEEAIPPGGKKKLGTCTEDVQYI